jgi:hypothetical protein
MKARVFRKSHTRREAGGDVTYRVGDTIELPERQYNKLRDRLERVVPRGRPPKKREIDPSGSTNAE